MTGTEELTLTPKTRSITIKSVNDLLHAIANIQRAQIIDDGNHKAVIKHQSTEFWYRGQKNWNWRLDPGIRRPLNNVDEKKELEYLYQFRQVAAPKFNSLQLDIWGWITYAQHHALPTRLLDWSTQPLIALYFACENEDEKRQDSKIETKPASEIDGAFYILLPRELNLKAIEDNSQLKCIREEGLPPLLVEDNKDLDPYHPKNGTEYNPPIAVRAPLLFERIIFQSGTFTIHPPTSPKTDGFEGCIHKLRIPAECKSKIRDELAILGISPYSIYRDLDRASRDITGRE